jgi:hypothetical protein
MRCVALLPVAFILAACAINPPAMGPETEIPFSPAYLSISLDDSMSSVDRETVQELVNATLQVITGERFARNLEGLGRPYRRIWLSPYGETMTPEGVAQIYLGEHRIVRPAPIVIEVANQGTPTQGFSTQGPLVSYIVLTPDVLARWRGDTLERRSCAVNSLAHELSHSFSQDPVKADYIFADKGKGSVFNLIEYFYGPLASYTIGTVAQCTMLEEANELPAGFAACLTTWGTDEFNSDYCGDPDDT